MVSTLLQPVSRLSSPTLRGFELNPFRVLRLPVNATTSDASFQAERVLTLVRAELPPEESDPLPWLPPSGIYEIQQAAQTVEEPLVRLTEQLLWFDFVRDHAGAQLQSALCDLNGEALQKYLSEESGLPKSIDDSATEEHGVAAMAHAINHANLRLLLAASQVNGVIVRQASSSLEPGKTVRIKWQKFQGLAVLPEAHNVIAGALGDTDFAPDQRNHWEGALRRWSRILNHPWFKLYVGECIADLNDDFTSTDDIETIEESLRTRLSDLAVKETRFLLLEGRYPLAGSIISAIARSGFEKRILGPALRPIHHLFQSEISELLPLLDESEQDGVGHIDAYLKRLEVIKQRWLAIDASGIVGLSHILDEATEQAYLRLRNRNQPSPELDALLDKAATLAVAQSLRQRVNFYRKELEEAKSRVCHFCKTGTPDYEKSVVLEGKKVTDTQYSGNTVTTYYGIRYGIVLRCERCARFHDFVGRVGLLAVLLPLPGLGLLFYPFIAENFGDLVEAVFSYGYFSIVAAFLILRYAIPFLAGMAWVGIDYAVAVAITPADHTRYGKYEDTEAYRSLKDDGYSVTALWKSNAVSTIEQKQQQ